MDVSGGSGDDCIESLMAAVCILEGWQPRQVTWTTAHMHPLCMAMATPLQIFRLQRACAAVLASDKGPTMMQHMCTFNR